MSVWHIHQHGDVWHHDINSIIKQRDQRGWVLPGDPPTTPKYATIFTCKAEFILPVTQIETYSRPDIDQLKFSRMENLGIPFSFGEWLKSRRKSLDLTQEELAQRSACSVFALRKIESGERRPSRQLAGLLAAALEIPPDDQKTFIQLARSELKLERLHLPSAGLPDASIRGQKPVSPRLPLPATGRWRILFSAKILCASTAVVSGCTRIGWRVIKSFTNILVLSLGSDSGLAGGRNDRIE